MQKPFFRFLKIALIGFPLALHAQEEPTQEREEDHSSFVALRLGSNIPGKGLNEEAVWSPQVAGGLSMALEGAWLPHRNIGIMVSGQYHQFKEAVLSPFSEPGYLSGQTREPWKTSMLLGGLYLSKPFLNWDLEARFLGGVGTTQSFSKFYERDKSPAYEVRYSYNESSIWYQTGITARIDKQKGWSIGLHYDLSFTDFPIKEIGTYPGNPSGTAQATINKNIRFSVFSFSLLYSFPHYKK